jgi:N-acetylglucosamine kinase-like BadF-type ATPase
VLLNNELYIGFDGGGTKTVCVVGDSTGNILASAIGGSTNLKSRPPEKVKEVITDLIKQLKQSDDIRLNQVKGVFVSTAGGDREEDRIRWKQWLFDSGLKPDHLIVDNDAIGSLAAGTRTTSGIVLISGTGSIAYAVRAGLVKPIRVGGWGYLFGDEGSGFDIGSQALTMIMRAHDGRDTEKPLFTEYILGQFGLTCAEQLITFIYEDPYPRQLIASIARHVITLAEQGEQNSKIIIQNAVNSLVELVNSIIKNDAASKTSPIVLSGGLFQSAYFKEIFVYTMKKNGINANLILPKYPPVVGAYICALLQTGEKITDEIEQNIDQSWECALKNL